MLGQAEVEEHLAAARYSEGMQHRHSMFAAEDNHKDRMEAAGRTWAACKLPEDEN